MVEIFVKKDYGEDFAGMRVPDVGAYTGGSSLFFALKGAKEVIAIEPSPRNLALAQKNIAESPFSDRTGLLLIGISGRDGRLTLHIDPDDTQADTLNPNLSGQEKLHSYGHQVETVEVWSFDRLLNYLGWEEVDLVKLDCEGAYFTPGKQLSSSKASSLLRA